MYGLSLIHIYTMLPGETYQSKIQPFFLTSRDGREFGAPNYILPGIGAHEFDFVELPDVYKRQVLINADLPFLCGYRR